MHLYTKTKMPGLSTCQRVLDKVEVHRAKNNIHSRRYAARHDIPVVEPSAPHPDGTRAVRRLAKAQAKAEAKAAEEAARVAAEAEAPQQEVTA